MLGLLFSEEACEGDDVCIDLLFLKRCAVAIGSHCERHMQVIVRMLRGRG